MRKLMIIIAFFGTVLTACNKPCVVCRRGLDNVTAQMECSQDADKRDAFRLLWEEQGYLCN